MQGENVGECRGDGAGDWGCGQVAVEAVGLRVNGFGHVVGIRGRLHVGRRWKQRDAAKYS